VQGRIVERHLPNAEKSFPGITKMYAKLADKPATFLQLVWLYEGRQQGQQRARSVA
jgi:hypothetical protein